MKYLLSCLLIVSSLVLFTSNAQAQGTPPGGAASINSFATVAGEFAVEALRDINFGFLVTTDVKTIAATSSDAGQFGVRRTTLTDSTSRNLSIAVIATDLINDADDDETLEFSELRVQLQDANSPSLSELFATDGKEFTGGAVIKTEDSAVQLSQQFFINVGGTLEAAAAAVGVYVGTITVELNDTTL